MNELLTTQLDCIIFNGKVANFDSATGSPFTDQQKENAVDELLQLGMITRSGDRLAATRKGKKALGY